MQPHPKQPENPFYNLIINIVIPTIVLNQSHRFGEQGPLLALIIALSFPVAYSVYEIYRSGRPSFIAIFGLLNVLFTGGFALFQLEGIWFAVKEAAFPAAIGLVVLISAFTSRPLVEMIIFRPEIFDVEKIEKAIEARGTEQNFSKSLRNATFMLAGSFALSSLLNFLLASYIFTPIDPSWSELQRSTTLNEQIADMTWMGYFVIALPLLAVMAGIFYYIVRSINRATGLKLNDLVRDPGSMSPSP